MYVIKRSGIKEPVNFNKITLRIQNLTNGLSENVDPIVVSQKTCQGVYCGVHTYQLDELACEVCMGMVTLDTDYAVLASRIFVSNLHKKTPKTFVKYIRKLTETRANQILSDEFVHVAMKYINEIEFSIKHEHDAEYDYFGLKTLERSYLLKVDGEIVERPQYLLMRLAIALNINEEYNQLESILETYYAMSYKYYTHATPTLFNAGTTKQQLSSCFLTTIKEDSIDGIFDTVKQCAQISKSAGGIGISVSNVRAKGSSIAGNQSRSSGIVPMLKVFNDTARYVDQGGRRKGSFAIYLEPWHSDIEEFLDLKKNSGVEENRARDLFYALWITDLFMERVESDSMWSLFCPSKATKLLDTWGDEFRKHYITYEEEKCYVRQIKARALWRRVITSQIETGMPYLLYKDSCNSKSNQMNLGTIRSSNLCTEVIQYSSDKEVAVCNLASIALPKFVESEDGKLYFNFESMKNIVRLVVNNLNKVIDITHYPVPEAKYSNMKHRPMGIGVQGLADVFAMFGYPFDSEEARNLNKKIFEHLYYYAVEASCDLAEIHGSYESFEGSPASKGLLQPHLWNEKVDSKWDELGQRVKQEGLYNSLLIAPMPTVSTSTILGNNECFEPFTSNIYVRRILAGDFVMVNKHLVRDLKKLQLWNKDMKNLIVEHRGSIQDINIIPKKTRDIYKTSWELSQKVIIDMARDRAPFVDQSMSMNLSIREPTYEKITSMNFYAWKQGLKTGVYYLRTEAAANPIQFTIMKTKKKVECNDDICITCSS